MSDGLISRSYKSMGFNGPLLYTFRLSRNLASGGGLKYFGWVERESSSMMASTISGSVGWPSRLMVWAATGRISKYRGVADNPYQVAERGVDPNLGLNLVGMSGRWNGTSHLGFCQSHQTLWEPVLKRKLMAAKQMRDETHMRNDAQCLRIWVVHNCHFPSPEHLYSLS